jgi:hypothetical protein
LLIFQWRSPILADMVWPALVLEQRIMSIAPIAGGLVVEWLVLWFGGFGLSWKRAAIVDLVMNVVSTCVGILLIPALGLMWEFFPGSFLNEAFHVGTFNYGTWAVTFAIAVLATSLIEVAVVKWGFTISISKRRFFILCLANTASVGIAFVSLWIKPTKL